MNNQHINNLMYDLHCSSTLHICHFPHFITNAITTKISAGDKFG